jgi:hypothetical protein
LPEWDQRMVTARIAGSSRVLLKAKESAGRL